MNILRLKSTAIVLFVICSVTFVGYFAARELQKQVNLYVYDLADKLTAEIGHKVTVDSINTNWDFASLKVIINDMVVNDASTKTPLFMADKIIGKIDIFGSLLNWHPVFSNITLQTPRLVLDWDGDNVPKVLGLSGEHLPGTIDPQMILKLLALQRKITVVNGDLHLQGKNGADLPFMNVNLEFRDKGNSMYSLLARGQIAAPTPPEFNFAVNYQGSLSDFKQALIDFEIKTSFLTIEKIFSFIPDYNRELLNGAFHDFDLKGAIQNGELRYLISEFNMDHVGIKGIEFANGLGHVEYRPTSDKLFVTAKNVELYGEKFYSEPIQIEKISGEVVNIYDKNAWYLSTNNLEIHALGIELHPHIKAAIEDNVLTALELKCIPKRANVAKVMNFMPDKMVSANLHAWLRNALVEGNVTAVELNYIPEKFALNMDFANTELRYSKDWPSIKDMDAHLAIADHKLLITSQKATVDGQKINEIITEFPITARPFQPIIVRGNIDTTLEQCLDYLDQTPLKVSLADKLAKFNPKGEVHLDLQLDVDVNTVEKSMKVNGDVTLQQATLDLPDINIPLTNINGNFKFTNTSVQAEALQLQILGQPANATIKLAESGQRGLQIDFAAPLEIAALKNLFPALSGLKVAGVTQIQGQVQVPWHNQNAPQIIKISSDLQGVSIDYPQPLTKTSDSKQQLTVEYHIPTQPTNMIALELQNKINASIFVRNGEFYGANIALGNTQASREVVDSLVISGKLDNFVWKDWEPYVMAEDRFAIMPVHLDLFINNLALNDTTYKNTAVKYDSVKRLWSVKNDILTGDVFVAEKQDKIEINLQKLKIDTASLKDKDSFAYFKNKHATNNLPLVQFYCEDLHFNDKNYRRVGLQLLPRTYGYEIIDLSIANDNVLLQAQGQWQMAKDDEFTQLSGNAYTKDFGNMLRDWQLGNSITRGAGELNFSLQWPGGPTAFSYLQLEGASHFDLRSGSLTEVKPGLGRVIGLLNLDSIQRRLQLDFRDVTERGLAFDKFVADIKFKPGQVASDNILINSPSARIELNGDLNLKSQQLDFTMFVTPKMGASIPVAAAIAVNPLVGAAIWALDKAAGSKISELSKFKYKVSGTWDSPKIDEVTTDAQAAERKG